MNGDSKRGNRIVWVPLVVGLAVTLSGCIDSFEEEPVPPEQARTDAYDHVAALVAELGDSTLVRAEELAYEAEGDFNLDVIEMDGGHRYEPPGVRLVLRTGPATHPGAYFPELCFDVWFQSEPVVWPKDNQYSMTDVECPEGAEPIAFDVPRPPLGGVDDRLDEALAELIASTETPTAADVEAVVEALELDPLVHVEVSAEGDLVGLGLRYGYTYECIQARTWPGHVEVWEHSPFELSFSPLCTGEGALLGRSGIES